MTWQDKSFECDLEQIARLSRGRGPTDRVRLMVTLNTELGARVDCGSAHDQQLRAMFLDELLSAIERDVRVRLALQLAGHPDLLMWIYVADDSGSRKPRGNSI